MKRKEASLKKALGKKTPFQNQRIFIRQFPVLVLNVKKIDKQFLLLVKIHFS